MVSFPYGPFSCIAVMSLVSGMSRMVQSFVFSLLLTQMTDLIWASSRNLFVGYTGLKFVGVLMALKLVVYGSCINMISYFWLMFSFKMSRCAFSDLLRLICNRVMLFGSSSCSLFGV